jgi:hypothetical protein
MKMIQASYELSEAKDEMAFNLLYVLAWRRK